MVEENRIPRGAQFLDPLTTRLIGRDRRVNDRRSDCYRSELLGNRRHSIGVIDIQREMLDDTEARARKAGLANVHGVLEDPDGSLPAHDESYDAAYLSSVLEELSDRQAMLREIRRVLKPG